MNGAGNRFGVYDARQRPDFAMTSERAISLCQKSNDNPIMGVSGADQILIMRAPKHADADLFMEIWNAGGFEVDACGNASRCIPWLIMEESGQDKLTLETNVGLLFVSRTGPMSVSVDMGKPRLEWDEIPLAEYMDTRVIDVKVGPIDAPILARPGAVSMGNPHCVFFVDDAETVAADKIGPMIEFHPLFPKQANIGFAQILPKKDGPNNEKIDQIRLRVWERGVGMTQACGTGACAALVAAHRQNRTGRQADIIMDGGVLNIDWQDNDHVIKTGPVALEKTMDLNL